MISLLFPFIVWFGSVGNILDYFDPDVPPGQFLYILSKLAGLFSISLLMLQFLLIVLRKLNISKFHRYWSTRYHQSLGLILVLLISAHVFLFVAAASLRSEHLVLHLFLPRLTTGYYDQMVSLGSLGFVGVISLVVIGRCLVVGRHIEKYDIRRIHRILVFFTISVITLHSIAIGSETSSLVMTVFYTTFIAIFLIGAYSLQKLSSNKINHVNN